MIRPKHALSLWLKRRAKIGDTGRAEDTAYIPQSPMSSRPRPNSGDQGLIRVFALSNAAGPQMSIARWEKRSSEQHTDPSKPMLPRSALPRKTRKSQDRRRSARHPWDHRSPASSGLP